MFPDEYKGEYGERVQRCADGAYRWMGRFDKKQNDGVIKVTVGVCGGLCLFFILMALVMGGDSMGPILLACLGVMAIVGIVCGIHIKLGGQTFQPYEMTEEYVHYVGTGKTDAYYHYKSIRSVTVEEGRNRIRVASLLSGAPVFVPEEDFSFVRQYILARLPDSATVTYR